VRVCLISLDYWPHRSSGLTIYAEDLARGLHESGHAVTVIAAQRPGTLLLSSVAGVDVQRVPIGPSDWIGYSWRAAQAVTRLAQAQPFDVVHFLDVHFAYAYRGPFVASLWQSFRQRLCADNGWPYASGYANLAMRLVYYNVARLWMEQVSLARAGRLIAACESTAQEFIVHYGVKPERISRAVQGTDLAALERMSCDALRHRLGLEGRRVVLFVGFATPRKGLEYMAQALRLLPEDVFWVIVGRWEPGYRHKVWANLGEAAGRVIEVGPIADHERAGYYSLADVYVSPSLLEGLGLTSIEAQACGTPAIVTDASSGPEEVGDAGLIVPARDASALASAIAGLLGNEAMRLDLGVRGRARVMQRFTYARMAQETLLAYEQFSSEHLAGRCCSRLS
jgi:glycosyltransferase involved in cell wall biosynthesis